MHSKDAYVIMPFLTILLGSSPILLHKLGQLNNSLNSKIQQQKYTVAAANYNDQPIYTTTINNVHYMTPCIVPDNY